MYRIVVPSCREASLPKELPKGRVMAELDIGEHCAEPSCSQLGKEIKWIELNWSPDQVTFCFLTVSHPAEDCHYMYDTSKSCELLILVTTVQSELCSWVIFCTVTRLLYDSLHH